MVAPLQGKPESELGWPVFHQELGICRAIGLVIALSFWAGLVHAESDERLAKIPRAIGKEPAYVSDSPRYGFIVFGPEMKTRIWVVLDKSTPEQKHFDVCIDGKVLRNALSRPGPDPAEFSSRYSEARTLAFPMVRSCVDSHVFRSTTRYGKIVETDGGRPATEWPGRSVLSGGVATRRNRHVRPDATQRRPVS